MNYYNDNDAGACAWIKELIRAGLIPEGHVDERSILDVTPADIAGYTQCHFFAGIGGWPYALRLAGWPESEPVWTASLPCQPWSAAGKSEGVGDERHLWPAFRDLIAECKPSVVFGEQVASKAGRLWLAGVRVDLERMGYAVGAADLCAASVGAPHIRQRLWWVAESQRRRSHGPSVHLSVGGPRQSVSVPAGTSDGGWVADRDRTGASRLRQHGRDGQETAGGIRAGVGECSGVDWSRTAWWPCRDGKWRRVPARRVADTDPAGRGEDLPGERAQRRTPAGGSGAGGGVGDESSGGCGISRDAARPRDCGHADGAEPDGGVGHAESTRQRSRADGTRGNGEGRLVMARAGARSDVEHGEQDGGLPDAEHDRLEVEPGLFPLADGLSARVGLLRGAGNAIVPQVAAAFIEAFIETKGD